MDQVVSADLYRYGGRQGIKGFRKALRVPGFRYTYLFRKASQYGRRTLPGLFFRLLKRHYSFKYGYQIPTGTQIGAGLYIGHRGTLVINENAVIGRNCNLAHNVTIGQANRGPRKGTPVIGDYVWIGTGAVIVGRVTIGSNVLIAPNAFVNTDVPANSVVTGNPAVITLNDKAVEGYVEFTL